MPLGEHNWENLIEDLFETIKYLKKKYDTQRIILCGHSFGSMLGMDFLQKYPNEVLGFIAYGVLVNTKKQDKISYDDLTIKVAKKGSFFDKMRFRKVDSAFPDVSQADYVKGVHLLSSLQMKFCYIRNPYLSILEKSPFFKTKDLHQIRRGQKYTDKLVGEVEYTYDITGAVDYQVPIFFLLGTRDDWAPSSV